MITKDQQKWLDHLSDTNKVTIVPWDPDCENRFTQVKQQIQSLLGDQQSVYHRGASSLKISGQDEIDIYIPIPEENYDQIVEELIGLYGDPRSNYPLKRARFVTSIGGKHIDVFVINQDDAGWKNSEIFNAYLLANPAILNEYCEMKEKAAGKSVREYYRLKIEFINSILARVKAEIL
jgi:GrpB-like predicted nucleotidyltransferase (UPF0157 family)